VTQSGKKKSKRKVLLFNDVIILAKTRFKKLQVIAEVPLDEYLVKSGDASGEIELEPKPQIFDTLRMKNSAEKRIVLSLQNEQERETWINDIQTQITHAHENARRKKQRKSGVWK